MQAETALKKWSFFGGGDKYEDAADKFQRAGHAFKASKGWSSAANAYKRAAESFVSNVFDWMYYKISKAGC